MSHAPPESALEHTEVACLPGAAPTELSPYTWACSHTSSFGTVTSAATAHHNDFWVGVTVDHDAPVPQEVVAALLEQSKTFIIDSDEVE